MLLRKPKQIPHVKMIEIDPGNSPTTLIHA
jgi:hypothetical protein